MKSRTMTYGLGTLALLALAACSWFEPAKNEPPKGSVDRRYQKSPDEVARASNDALAQLNIPVSSDNHDALGGQINAQRSNETADKVTIWYQSVDPRTTQVSVGVGKGNRELAQMIQDQIAQHLGAPSARAMPTVGARTEGTYDQPIAQCLAAAEQSMKNLKMDISSKETHDTWARVESRQADALPVSIRMDRTDQDKTMVVFSAGSAKSQDTMMIAERLKAEFERVINTGNQQQAPAK
jgi:hypothetical protein